MASEDILLGEVRVLRNEEVGGVDAPNWARGRYAAA
jgi:hypothetical protein